MIPGTPPPPPTTERVRSYGPVLRPVLAAMLVAGVVWNQSRSTLPEGGDTRATLADLLARDHGLILEAGTVRPAQHGALDSIQPSPSAQGIYFTARRGEGGEPDVFRADVRLASDGRVVDLSDAQDLTRTPFASERPVAGSGPWSLYEVRVQGQLQSVLLVDDRGDERASPQGDGWLQERLFSILNFMETGRFGGVGLRLYSFSEPPESVEAEFHDHPGATSLRLVVKLAADAAAGGDAEPAPGRPVRIRPDTGEVQVGGDLVRYEPRLRTTMHFTHWCADFLRSLPFVGPRPVALLEKWAFTGIDHAQRLGFALGLVSADDVGAELAGDGEAPQELLAEYDAHLPWPPKPVRSLIEPPVESEGRWVPFDAEWLRRHPEAPAAIYKTALRTDPERPRSLVILAAVDLRQVDLSMVAGTVEPHTATGRRGQGRFPRTPAVVERVIGAFNGGFQTAHGAFGMMVDRQVIIPAMPNVATLAVRDSGEVSMGTWNNSMSIPEDQRSFRQNLPPLVADGVWNPTRVKRWGGTVSDLDKVNTTRSAVGIAGPHTLIYAWGASLSAEDIGRALLQAGADYGMHLDMNPFHAGFWILRAAMEDLGRRGKFKRYDGQSLSKKIQFEGDRFINRNAKDFFYLTLRRLFHEQLPPPPRGFAPWRPHLTSGLQDSFLPRVAVSEGDRQGDLLVAVDLSSLDADLQPGAGESSALDGLGRAPVTQSDAAARVSRPVALLDLDVIAPTSPLGLNARGRAYWPPRPDLPALSLSPAGRLGLAAVVTPEVRRRPHRQAIPWILGGQRVQSSSAVTGLGAVGARRWHVLGFSSDGTVAYYLTRRVAEAAQLQQPLEDLGVPDAVALPPTDEDKSRLLLLERSDGEGDVTATDPLDQDTITLAELDRHPTRLMLTAAPSPARSTLLEMKDVELTRREARRQRRMRDDILIMRAGLRDIANRKYRRYIEKVKLKREAKSGVKEWDAE